MSGCATCLATLAGKAMNYKLLIVILKKTVNPPKTYELIENKQKCEGYIKGMSSLFII